MGDLFKGRNYAAKDLSLLLEVKLKSPVV